MESANEDKYASAIFHIVLFMWPLTTVAPRNEIGQQMVDYKDWISRWSDGRLQCAAENLKSGVCQPFEEVYHCYTETSLG